MTLPLTRDAVVALLELHATFSPVDGIDVRVFQASDELPLWQALEAACGTSIDPPYFAIPWPAARALAAWLHEPEMRDRIAARRRVVDIGCGSGLVACALARAGASHVEALDRDAFAVVATDEAARRNGHADVVHARVADVLADPEPFEADVVIVADFVSRQQQAMAMAQAVACWRQNSDVYLLDSGRPFFDAFDGVLVAARDVVSHNQTDTAGVRRVRLFHLPRSPVA